MLEFASAMSASVPFTRIHWYVYVGLVSPSASVMPVVAAVSVRTTCAVPVMVGAPAAAVLVGALVRPDTGGSDQPESPSALVARTRAS